MAKNGSIRITKQHVFIGIGVLILLASAVGVGVLVRLLQNSATTPESTGEGQTQGFLEERLPENIKEAQNLANSGKIEESNSKLQEDIQKAERESNNDAKYESLFQLSLNYSNQGNYPKAIATLKEAEKVKQEYRLSRLMGDFAVEVNNTSLAVQYYKKALTQVDPNNPLSDTEKRYIQNKINELGD